MSQESNPAVRDAESHWSHPDPASQPPRDVLIGIGRMVMEARAKLGCRADSESVTRELQSRGMEVTREQVAQFWDRTC
jgi:hypothetical protein